MVAQGMSMRAIAERVGVSHVQVRNDVASSTNPLTVEDATLPSSRKEQVLRGSVSMAPPPTRPS